MPFFSDKRTCATYSSRVQPNDRGVAEILNDHFADTTKALRIASEEEPKNGKAFFADAL